MRNVIAALAAFVLVGLAPAQQPRGRVAPLAFPEPQEKAPPGEHQRGRVSPPNLPALKAAAAERNGLIVRALAPATEKEWDSRKLGFVGPVKNQGNCGSCWDFSGVGVVEISAIKAGVGKPGEFLLSEQYVLDCNSNGGCNGDDNTTVLSHAKKTGLAYTKDYGNYYASERQCRSNGLKLFKITDWGFCDGGRGYDKVSETQLIKNAIKAYGSVGCAVAANSTWDGYRGGVHTGNSRQIDHDVILVGWKDDAQVHGGGYWIMRNSWGPSWGEGGYMKIGYGSDSIGTEAVFARVEAAPPEPPTPPVPPVPAPPQFGGFKVVFLVCVFLGGGLLVGVVVVLTRVRK